MHLRKKGEKHPPHGLDRYRLEYVHLVICRHTETPVKKIEG